MTKLSMFEKINTLNDLRSKKSFLKRKLEIYIKLTNAFSRKKKYSSKSKR